VSKLPFGRVAECVGANNVMMKRSRVNYRPQQWFFDGVTKTIRNNNWKSHSLDIQSNGGSSNIRCTTTNSRWWQLFRLDGRHLVNEKGKVVEVQNQNVNTDMENRNVMVNNRGNDVRQQWEIVYVDEYKEPKKGELNEDFGIYVERDFYIVSQMGSHRYLDLINNRNFVIKTANGRKTQVWYFHQQSKTIRTRLNNQSWDIKSAGRTQNMQIWSTNSGWF
jgi:hypothetical protein